MIANATHSQFSVLNPFLYDTKIVRDRDNHILQINWRWINRIEVHIDTNLFKWLNRTVRRFLLHFITLRGFTLLLLLELWFSRLSDNLGEVRFDLIVQCTFPIASLTERVHERCNDFLLCLIMIPLMSWGLRHSAYENWKFIKWKWNQLDDI